MVPNTENSALNDPSPILYRSEDGLITLLDLPESIRDGLWPRTDRARPRPISAPAREEPFDGPEAESPPGADKKTQKLIEAGLTHIRNHVRTWCLPRPGQIGDSKPDINLALQENLVAMTKFGSTPSTICLGLEENAFSYAEIFNRCVANESSEAVTLLLDGRCYYIPSKSVFIHGTIPESLSNLRTAYLELMETPYFDFITMDPPWPNRSARRKGDYREDQSIKKLLYSIPLRQIAAYNALVGIWITNKPKYRALAIDLMKSWGLVLVEEWIWIKITANGEPITAVDSSWRKPWETLLLSRRYKPGEAQRHPQVVTRIIAAVPDIHSRKPCLKRLVEPYLSTNYQALEMFARHVTAGWWAVGNEPLKFNRNDWWLSENIDTELIESVLSG